MNGGGRRGGGPSIAPHRLLGNLSQAEGKDRTVGERGRRRDERGPAKLRTEAAAVARPPVPLLAPYPLTVEAEDGPDGPVPQWVVWRGQRRGVVAIEDEWRVDDEWWRDEVSRHYFAVRVEGDRRLTVFLDRVAGTWWQHS